MQGYLHELLLYVTCLKKYMRMIDSMLVMNFFQPSSFALAHSHHHHQHHQYRSHHHSSGTTDGTTTSPTTSTTTTTTTPPPANDDDGSSQRRTSNSSPRRVPSWMNIPGKTGSSVTKSRRERGKLCTLYAL